MILGGGRDEVLHKALGVLLRECVEGKVGLEDGRVEPDVLRHPASRRLEIGDENALIAAAPDLLHAAVRQLDLIVVFVLDDRLAAPEKALEIEMLVPFLRKAADAFVDEPAVDVHAVVEGGNLLVYAVAVPIAEHQIADLRIGHGEINGRFVRIGQVKVGLQLGGGFVQRIQIDALAEGVVEQIFPVGKQRRPAVLGQLAAGGAEALQDEEHNRVEHRVHIFAGGIDIADIGAEHVLGIVDKRFVLRIIAVVEAHDVPHADVGAVVEIQFLLHGRGGRERARVVGQRAAVDLNFIEEGVDLHVEMHADIAGARFFEIRRIRHADAAVGGVGNRLFDRGDGFKIGAVFAQRHRQRARAVDPVLLVLQKFHRNAIHRHRSPQIDGHGAAVGVDEMRPEAGIIFRGAVGAVGELVLAALLGGAEAVFVGRVALDGIALAERNIGAALRRERRDRRRQHRRRQQTGQKLFGESHKPFPFPTVGCFHSSSSQLCQTFCTSSLSSSRPSSLLIFARCSSSSSRT